MSLVADDKAFKRVYKPLSYVKERKGSASLNMILISTSTIWHLADQTKASRSCYEVHSFSKDHYAQAEIYGAYGTTLALEILKVLSLE